LAAAIAICGFINEEEDNISTSFLRAVCKILSKMYIDTEQEDSKSLKVLKQGLEDLATTVTDHTALSYVENLIGVVDDVRCDDETEESKREETEQMIENEDCDERMKTLEHKNEHTNRDNEIPACKKSERSVARGRTSNGDEIPTFASLGVNHVKPKRPTRTSRTQGHIPLFASVGIAGKQLNGSESSDLESCSSDDSSSSYESSDSRD
jgi:hypothetical protein